MRPSRDLTVYLTSSFRLRFSDWRTCQGTLHRLNQLSGSNGLLEKGEGTQPQRLGFDIRPPKCRDVDNGHFRRGTARRKNAAPTKLCIRRVCDTKVEWFLRFRSFFQ